jgi:spore photoproduct lyase
MIETIYIEEQIAQHPRTLELLARFPEATQIYCERYGEIFNRKAQSFRLQKKQPALILAEKHKGFVLPTPENYGIGAKENYYFSHMMNCLYDCRYCFLQGMYQSAHYVLFVNYEGFAKVIEDKIQKAEKEIHFFSGYDCDSLALEPVTKFLDYFLPVFRANPDALLEIRTKSTQIRTLLNTEPLENCVLAWSFTPTEISDYKLQYQKLFTDTIRVCNPELLHSVSLGSFRLPKGFFKSLQKMYPSEKLFASPLEDEHGMISYKEEIRSEMLNFCSNEILNHIPEEKFFPCQDVL